jgi:hypothetical protein
MAEQKFILELKKEFNCVREIVDYLRTMAKDVDNYKVSNYPDWQIYLKENEEN